VALVAVKPQMMGAALPALQALGGGGTLFVSIAAGTTIAAFEARWAPGTPIVRTMPNTPAMVGRGITALCGNAHATPETHLALAETLMAAVGEVVRSGRRAPDRRGHRRLRLRPGLCLPPDRGAGGGGRGRGPAARQWRCNWPAPRSAGRGNWPPVPDTAAQLRVNVTSPGGTTAAALAVLMDPDTGLPALMAAPSRRRRPRAGAGQMTITYDDFQKVDIRVGRITRAEPYPEARKPAIKLWVDFGPGDRREAVVGPDHAALYAPRRWSGRQVLAVVNFPPRQIGKVMSEVLVLGVPDAEGRGGADRPRTMMCPGRKDVLTRLF
jgi:pyrroline-5-carboxylate reductase